MKKMRSLHLWIGLICSVLILIESITGLLLSEPRLMGSSEGGQDLNRWPPMGIIKGLHEGRIGART